MCLASVPLASRIHLAGCGVGCGELGVGGGPDPFDAAAGTNEESRRGEGHKGHQQRVLDEILALFVCCKVTDEVRQCRLSFCIVLVICCGLVRVTVAYLATTEVLAGRRVSCGELRIRGGPDATDAAAGTDEQGRGGERYESHQQGVFNQVLTLLIVEKSAYNCFHLFPSITPFRVFMSDLHFL